METREDILERISDLGLPVRHSQSGSLPRFRVTWRVTLRGEDLTEESEFCYPNLVAARQHYRKLLLALYRAKEVEAFAICLNRMAVGIWVEPIHLESVHERG